MESKLPYTVAFIEDELVIRQNYVNFLRRYYKKVYEVSSANEGYRIFEEYKPDIMIVDINLGKMNGLEMIRKIRKQDQNTKMIVLTANSSNEYLLESTDLKLTKYLIKPISREELKEALEIAQEEIEQFYTTTLKTVALKSGCLWNKHTGELFVRSQQVKLTKQERKIFSFLIENINNHLSYEKILEDIWGDYEGKKLNALKTAMKQLRRKLPDETICNIYGFGYTIKS